MTSAKQVSDLHLSHMHELRPPSLAHYLIMANGAERWLSVESGILTAAATKRDHTQTGLIVIRQLDIVLFATSPVCNVVMSIKLVWIAVVGLLFSTASAWAAGSALEGVVKDAKGRPIDGADIRVETNNGRRLLTTLKTDVNGRYIVNDLAAGTYRVTLFVNGAVKTCIKNTTIKSGETTQLSFDLTSAPASRASVTLKKGRHWVWIPAFTGSRLPGHWVELDNNGSWAAEASSFNVVRISAEELQRTVHSVCIKRGQ